MTNTAQPSWRMPMPRMKPRAQLLPCAMPSSSSSGTGLSAPNHAAHRFDQLGGIVADTVFEHGLNVLDVFDLLRRVALDHDQIRLLAGSDGADAVELSQELRAIRGRNVNGLQRCESRFNQQLNFALIAEARDHPSHAGGIEPGNSNPPACAKACSNSISFLNAAGQGDESAWYRCRITLASLACTLLLSTALRASGDRASRMRCWMVGRPGTIISKTGSVDVTATWC